MRATAQFHGFHPGGIDPTYFLEPIDPRPGVLSGGSIQIQKIKEALYISCGGDVPATFRHVVSELQRLYRLQPDWDSYGAPPPYFDAIVGAVIFMTFVTSDDIPAPIVTPTSKGGIQLEWHCNGVDLEVEIQSQHRFSVFFTDSEDIDHELEITHDISPLEHLLEKVSMRTELLHP